MDVREAITARFEAGNGNVFDFFIDLYADFFTTADDPAEILEAVMETAPLYDLEEESASLYAGQRMPQQTIEASIDKVVGAVRSIAAEDPSRQEFYRSLFDRVFCDDAVANTDVERGILLAFLALYCPGVPYYPVKDPVILSDADYERALSRISPSVFRLMAAMNGCYHTKVGKATQVLNLLEELEDREDRIVLLSCLTGTETLPEA